MNTPLYCWVWESVLTDWTDGMAVAYAADEAGAWDALKAADHTAWWVIRGEPEDRNDPRTPDELSKDVPRPRKVTTMNNSELSTIGFSMTDEEAEALPNLVEQCINETLSEEFMYRCRDQVNWVAIVEHQKLSEPFMRKVLAYLNMHRVATYQTLSETFMEEFANSLSWSIISEGQDLSETFMEKHANRLLWSNISECQNLSEAFIARNIYRISFNAINVYRNLSEEFLLDKRGHVFFRAMFAAKQYSESFLETFRDSHVAFPWVIKYQNLSEEFLKKCSDHERSLYVLRHTPSGISINEYADKHGLTIDDTYLYAFRNHTHKGRGQYLDSTRYQKNVYYRDWHCDLDCREDYTYGFGIWPEGNTPVRIKREDWGCAVRDPSGVPDEIATKARVWGFEIYR